MTQRQGHPVIVAGGGMVGVALALALAQGGLEVEVCEQGDPEAQLAAGYDGRTCAISAGSRHFLESLGAWAAMAPDAGPIRDIHVSDGHAPVLLHFDHRDGGAGPLGHIVENRVIRRALYQAALASPRLTFLARNAVTAVRVATGGAEVTLADGATRKAALLAVADGRQSTLRAQLGIAAFRKDYRQTAIVCTLRQSEPHREIACERFFPAGPFALLPMRDPHSVSLVWCEPTHLAPRYLALPEEEFVYEVRRRAGEQVGEMTLLSARYSYPLTLTRARRYALPHVALVGDAAHGMHPLAGQGVNLGFRDAAELTDRVLEAARLGLSPGDASAMTAYDRARQADVFALLAATDGLNALFSNHSRLLRVVRDAGVAAVEHTPPLKRLFMRYAMGVSGTMPKAMREEEKEAA